MAKELSVFVDESGDRGGEARHYLLTLVFHDQADSIAEAVTGYEAKLARADLPNIPFHSEPLMNGHKDYELLGIEQRKAMLAHFSSFVRRLPISYVAFVYRRSQFEDPARLMERMGRDISSAVVEHLGFFQSFDDAKAYYDNGRDIVKQALDRSVGKVLSKGGRPSTQDLDDRLPPRASGGLSLHHRTRLGQVRGQGGWRDVQQVLRGHRPFQEELAQASPRQADIGGSATPQGSDRLSFGEEADRRRGTPGDELRAAKAEVPARASRALITVATPIRQQA